MLDKQVQILSVDTSHFFSNNEMRIYLKLHKIKYEIKKLEIQKWNIDAQQFKDLIKLKKDYEDKLDNKLKKILKNKVETNINQNGTDHIRVMREADIKDRNIISVFESFFTRTIKAETNKFTDDFLVVQTYYFDVIKDLIYHGFMYKNEKYIYFTSSAGQIRTKKTVFIKESVWKKNEKTIMCGLTLDKINENGGNNPNKHLAYLALTNSATDVWEDFDIDKTIVIDDFETQVYGTYDFVNDEDYSITRTQGYVPITHTDGCGMMLPSLGKNRMVRLSWIKGLLGAFDFVKFIKEHNCSPVIKDIYGVEHDIIKEDIQIIFTKSQFKLYEHYQSWEQFKEYYKKYNCTAGYANIERDKIDFATINYQMLQTLTDITDDEIESIAHKSISKLNNLCNSLDNIKNFLNITPYNTHKTFLQKSIELYPDLINDNFIKYEIKQVKDSWIKKYKSGKLSVDGKYTFILPDLYAACEYWFMGIKNPNGLLNDGEVYCNLFENSSTLDCLRSPHLYREHAIRNNIAYNKVGERKVEISKWFGTNALYTSCKDLISKILQFDVDGDTALVVSDKKFIEIAKRNMNGIVPLYYNMRKAEPCILNNENIYHGLEAAFTGSNIGQYSNNITKIWNSPVFINGNDEEKEDAIKAIKLLCCEDNFKIDYAKTLYMPKRPKFAKKLISKYTKQKVPHFFKYAKDKENNQVEDLNNSLVNKLEKIIPNPRLNFRNLGLHKIDFTLLMKNPCIPVIVSFNNKGKIIKEETDDLIVEYDNLIKQYGYKFKIAGEEEVKSEVKIMPSIHNDIIYSDLRKQIRFRLSRFGYSEEEIADILTKYLYSVKDSRHKMILWECYGEYLYNNLKRNLKEIGLKKMRIIQCVDCGCSFKVDNKNKRAIRCFECQQKHRRIYKTLKEQERRKALKKY